MHAMKLKIIVMSIATLFSCQNIQKEECDLEKTPIEKQTLTQHNIDSIITYPRSLNVFHDKLLFMQPNASDKLFVVLNKDSLNLLFSGGSKGHTLDEFINLNRNYFSCTDSSFFALDANIEKEITIKNGRLKCIDRTPIIIPDALNQLVKTGIDSYIASGLTNGQEGEHILYKEGEYSFFGEYPEQSLQKEERFKFNFKSTVGRTDKKQIWDFYYYMNLIRSYDTNGNLVKEIKIKDSFERPQKNSAYESQCCYHKISANSHYIVALYSRGYTMSELYKKLNIILEVQLWSWKGELKRRILFDKPFDLFSISEDNILYAMCSETPNIIYTYDFNEK